MSNEQNSNPPDENTEAESEAESETRVEAMLDAAEAAGVDLAVDPSDPSDAFAALSEEQRAALEQEEYDGAYGYNPQRPMLTQADGIPAYGEVYGPRAEREGESDPMVYAKLFCPWAAGTWWVLEFDPTEQIAFCFAYLGDEWCAELGDVSLEELEEVRGPAGLCVERDLYFKPCRLSEALANHGLHEAAAKFK
jgi:hypothetical protein